MDNNVERFAKWLKEHLSTKNDGVPGSELWFKFGEMDEGKPMFTATTFNNDGHELWLCYTRGKWLFHCGADEARRLAWFILWDWWVVATWCGIKRRTWFWANRKLVERYRVK